MNPRGCWSLAKTTRIRNSVRSIVGVPGNVGVDSVELFVLLAEMNLASSSKDQVLLAVDQVMLVLQKRGDVDRYSVSVKDGIVEVKWWPKFPATEFKARFAIANLNPAEAAVASVMAS